MLDGLEPASIAIVIVEDDRRIREGLRVLLDGTAGFRCVNAWCSMEEALKDHWSQLPDVAKAKIEGLVRFYGVSDDATLRFFRVHEQADVEHSAVCADLLRRLPSWREAEAERAATMLADGLWAFLTGVEARRLE